MMPSKGKKVCLNIFKPAKKAVNISDIMLHNDYAEHSTLNKSLKSIALYFRVQGPVVRNKRCRSKLTMSLVNVSL